MSNEGRYLMRRHSVRSLVHTLAVVIAAIQGARLGAAGGVEARGLSAPLTQRAAPTGAIALPALARERSGAADESPASSGTAPAAWPHALHVRTRLVLRTAVERGTAAPAHAVELPTTLASARSRVILVARGPWVQVRTLYGVRLARAPCVAPSGR